MAEREIKIGFPEVKMEALEFFLKENDTTVEKVLREHLDKTYEKSVPQQRSRTGFGDRRAGTGTGADWRYVHEHVENRR